MKTDPRILVVDDEAVMREFLLEILENYQPLGVEDGEKAWQLIQSQEVSLVISDLKMPGMDGLELLRRIKQYDEDIPVIIITGYASLQTSYECIRRGAAGFLKKPFTISQIRAAVDKVMQMRGEQASD
ncbi:MAG: response regulator [candidate division Zixibacteria bacterium]|nr:response regulator [candidate division Zixibacteria bacterium]